MATLTVFAARETPQTLANTLKAAAIACERRGATLEVLTNGNLALAQAAAVVCNALPVPFRVHFILAADKANAWNQHLHVLAASDDVSFYIDGQVLLQPNALVVLQYAIEAHPQPWAASAVPTGDKKSCREGSFWGGFCAFTAAGKAALRQRNIFLPYGIYRTDSSLASAFSIGLDPRNVTWDRHRTMAFTAQPTWRLPRKQWWRAETWQAFFSRRRRQACGVLENQAIRHHLIVEQRPPNEWPEHVRDLIAHWICAAPAESERILRSRRMRVAADDLLNRADPNPDDLSAVLMAERL